MTSTPNEPITPDPHNSSDATDQPSWGSAPSAPPAGSGSDHTAGQAPWSDGTSSNGNGNNSSNGNGSNGTFTTPPGARLFDGVRRLGIVRPDQGRWGAGVAAGIARRYGFDPVVARIAFVVLTLLGGLGVTLYGLGWLFLPHPDGRIHAQQVLMGTVTAGFVGSLAVVLLSTHHALPLLVVALVAFLIVRHRRTSPHRAA